MRRRGSRFSDVPVERPALGASLRSFAVARPARGRRSERLLAWLFTIGAHVIVLAALAWPRAAPPPSDAVRPPSLVVVSLFALPEPRPPGPPATEVEPLGLEDVILSEPPSLVAPILVPRRATTPAPDDYADVLSEGQLAGVMSAGAAARGGAGGGCDTAAVVQRALRRDPLVRRAVEDANRLGKAVMLWNGDWVQTGGQDGKGLSAVREAVMWEVGFTPEACRNQRMHGLVVLSLADGTRFAIGADDWRWSDLLGVTGVRRDR